MQDLLILMILISFTNVGLLILAWKWKFWQLFKIKEACFFCFLFWCSMIELAFIGHEWTWLFKSLILPLSLGAASAGVYISKDLI